MVSTIADFLLSAPSGPDRSASDGTDWALVLAIIATVAGAISAVAVIVGAVYWFRTRKQRRERAEREEQVSRDVAEMGDRLEEPQQVLDAVVADQHGRQPRPRVSFVAQSGPAEHVVIVKHGLPPIDVEAIVSAERAAALGTLLPMAGEAPELPGALGTFNRQVAQMNRILGLVGGQLP